ncbi:MAG: helicase-exonuclease AddAB subunit AddA [Lachnospiraceae bacterium]|nr:helicase-exonuclease AddAB subunit AddA [Lachnospiraceae bacterium]
MKFTPDQQKCIDIHGKNILVSAAAGSGKTAVLTERIIRMVCHESDPVDIDRILVVTFTKAAAAEMRARIEKRLYEELEKDPENVHLQRQLSLIYNAQITTIDSFSLFIVKNHFNKIGLEPGFRVADEAEMQMLREDVMEKLLEDYYKEDSDDFKKCLEFFCRKTGDKELKAMIDKLSSVASSMPWPDKWLIERKNDYRDDSACKDYLMDLIIKYLESCVAEYEKMIEIIQSPDGPYMYGELVDGEYEAIQKTLMADTFEKLYEKVSAISFGSLPRKKDDSVSPMKRELVQGYRNGVKDIINKKIMGEIFATPFDLADLQAAECAEVVDVLVDMTLDFDERVANEKSRRKIIDFSDMEHFALKILMTPDENGNMTVSDVAKEYREFFREVMIDEYQDSNLVQEYILSAVAGDKPGTYNRFLVGDVKQSIYRFRQARPDLFLEKYGTYGDESCDETRIDLSNNFRSREEVIKSVNSLFERIMQEDSSKLAYDDKAALYVGADYYEYTPDKSSEILFSCADGLDFNKKMEREATLIATKIGQLMKSMQVQIKDSKEFRPLKYSDIVILFRSGRDREDIFKKVLEKNGIPAYTESKKGYFGAKEITVLINLLKVLDNPLQDIPVFAVMRSVFGGFSDEEIALLRADDKKTRLFKAVTDRSASDKEDELTDKSRAFVDMITRYRQMAKTMSVHELLIKINAEHDYLDYVSALPAGEKRRSNVEMLFTKALSFEKTSMYGLFQFVRYIEQIESYSIDEGEAQMIDENANVVRIMSIHKSKGLEFPVVFVASLDKQFNESDIKEELICDSELGLGIMYFNPGKRIKNNTLRHMAISAKIKQENVAEEIRILYVALTRAREKLILTGNISTAEYDKIVDEAYGERENPKRLAYGNFIKTRRYLDLITPFIKDISFRPSFFGDEELKNEFFASQLENAKALIELNVDLARDEEDKLQLLSKRFEYVYPYEHLRKLYTKTSVSELKIASMAVSDEEAYSMFEPEDVPLYVPRFKKAEEPADGATRGSAYHRCMEIIDFDRVLGPAFEGTLPASFDEYLQILCGDSINLIRKNTEEFLDENVKSGKLSSEYRGLINTDKVLNFFKTKLSYRMWMASKRGDLYREQPFVYGISADRLSGEFSADEKVLIQGIIDVFFVEDGNIVLMDYKTDTVSGFDRLWERYSVQLDYYSEALCSIRKMPVKEKIIYSFYLEAENGILT